MNDSIIIKKATKEDNDDIWIIIEKVIKKGDTYVFDPETSKKEMLNFWCGKNNHSYVAEIDNKVVGTFFIKDNYPSLGSHVANAGYMVSPDAFGKGIGRSMGEFSLIEAKKLGYKAMQFNFVVKSNMGAVKLWQKLGFEIKGEIPKAFNHKTQGLTDIYIMWREL